jgi:hypothetical protein
MRDFASQINQYVREAERMYGPSTPERVWDWMAGLFTRAKRQRQEEADVEAWRRWARTYTEEAPKATKAPRKPELPDHLQAHLRALGLSLTVMPTFEQLATARRKAMLRAHPDRGGSHTAATRINRAFEELSRSIERRKS